MEAEGQEGGAAPVGEESEVADAHEAGRQQMEQEAAQELILRQSHEPFLVAVGGIAPAQGDVAIMKRNEPGVGDGDAMGVGAEIAQHMFRSSEWPLGVDDPVVAEQHPQPGGEGAWLRKVRQVSVELKLIAMEGVAKPGDELAAEDAAEHADGEKEVSSREDPAGVARCEATGGNYAVDVRMKLQALVPAVEHAEETDLGTEMPRIASNFKQGLSTGVKEQVVDPPFVLQCERGKFPRQSEDGMDVAGGQKLPFARL